MGPRQIYYENNLFNKHKGNQWRCNRCDSMTKINEKELKVEKGPILAHLGHEYLPRLRIEVLKAIKKNEIRSFA